MVVAAGLLAFISGASGARHTARVHALFRATRSVSFLIFVDRGQQARTKAMHALINRYTKSSA